MWRGMDSATRAQSALVVHPYDHGGKSEGQPVIFPKGEMQEAFGDYPIRWLNYVRSLEPAPVPLGQVTYYQLFGKGWCTDAFEQPAQALKFPLGKGMRQYRYNPYAPASPFRWNNGALPLRPRGFCPCARNSLHLCHIHSTNAKICFI